METKATHLPRGDTQGAASTARTNTPSTVRHRPVQQILDEEFLPGDEHLSPP
jgi:hypothetical protein